LGIAFGILASPPAPGHNYKLHLLQRQQPGQIFIFNGPKAKAHSVIKQQQYIG